MNSPTHTSSSPLLDRCLTSLRTLESTAELTPEQQALYDRIVSCDAPATWDEAAFDNDLYHALTGRLQELERGNEKLYDILYRLNQLKPTKSPLPDFI